jgi:hypothetical protein
LIPLSLSFLNLPSFLRVGRPHFTRRPGAKFPTATTAKRGKKGR